MMFDVYVFSACGCKNEHLLINWMILLSLSLSLSHIFTCIIVVIIFAFVIRGIFHIRTVWHLGRSDLCCCCCCCWWICIFMLNFLRNKCRRLCTNNCVTFTNQSDFVRCSIDQMQHNYLECSDVYSGFRWNWYFRMEKRIFFPREMMNEIHWLFFRASVVTSSSSPIWVFRSSFNAWI